MAVYISALGSTYSARRKYKMMQRRIREKSNRRKRETFRRAIPSEENHSAGSRKLNSASCLSDACVPCLPRADLINGGAGFFKLIYY
jgi:hypothetical protein